MGGKNASLGEMFSNLSKEGIKVPDGFATTSFAFDLFLEKAGIRKEIKNILKDLDTHKMANLRSRGKKIRDLILKSDLTQ